MGLTNAQKRTLDDLKIHGGIVVYVDKGGRIWHSRQPIMDLPSVKVVDKSPLAEARGALKKIVNLGDNAGDWTEAMYEIAVEALEAENKCPTKPT